MSEIEMITEHDCFKKFPGLQEIIVEIERIAGPGVHESPSSNTLGLGWWVWAGPGGAKLASIELPGIDGGMTLSGKGRVGATMPWLAPGEFKAGVMPTIEEARAMAEWLMKPGDEEDAPLA